MNTPLYEGDEPLYMADFKEEDAKLVADLRERYPHLTIESCSYKEYLKAFFGWQDKQLKEQGLDPLIDRPINEIWLQASAED